MKKMIPINKMSKKKKKEFYSLKRNDWGELNPVSKVDRDKTKYTRKIKHKNNQF